MRKKKQKALYCPKGRANLSPIGHYNTVFKYHKKNTTETNIFVNKTWWSYTLLLNAYKYINKSQQNYFFHMFLSRWIWVYFLLLLRHVVCQLTSRKIKCTLSAGHYTLYTTWHTKPTKDTLITKLVRKLEAFKLDGIIVP